MNRRTFLAGVVALPTVPFPVAAQPARRPPRVGMLLTGSPAQTEPLTAAFRQRLRDLGYVDGQNIIVEPRWAEGAQRLAGLAAELVRDKFDVIVTQGTPAAEAAKRATGTIPIVMATSGDPIGVGLVASLARPGGNITGHNCWRHEARVISNRSSKAPGAGAPVRS